MAYGAFDETVCTAPLGPIDRSVSHTPGTGLEENNRFFIGHWAQQCVYGVFSCTVVTEAYTCASLACNCWEYTENVKDVIVKQESFDRIVLKI